MLFNSLVFPIFLLTVWTLYVCLKHRAQNAMLVVASYVFYGWWDWRFLALLFISTLTDYYGARIIDFYGQERRRAQRFVLVCTLLVNLGILGFFKYFNFFAESFAQICTPLGFRPDFFTLNILLPIGISFYTFQTMAYTIDVYRGKDKVCRNFIDFALYVAYFPALVAGPIERSTRLIPQIVKPRIISPAIIYGGVQLILMGYFKKVFIADGVAPIVDRCFSTPESYGGFGLLFGVYLFLIQCYGDFSGYNDIARGVSRLFGIELCLNFRQPLLSTNIAEFWRRWHISMSTWFRDYVYFPLGGSRCSPRRAHVNTMGTMLIVGLWHGAALHFIVWGGLHGLCLVVQKILFGERKPNETTPWDKQADGSFFRRLAGWSLRVFITFNVISFVSIFLRAESCLDACRMIGWIVQGGFQSAEIPALYFAVYGLCVLAIDLPCAIRNSEVPFDDRWGSLGKGFAYASLLFLMLCIGENGVQPFIYFQF